MCFVNIDVKILNKMLAKARHLGGSAVEHLPLAQGVTPGSWD